MAADKAVEFNKQLEEHRGNLTANQLKRARKKRAKLFQQALTADLVDGCQPAAKRTKFSDEDWSEPSMSSQLQDGSTCEQQQQEHSLTHTAEGRLAEHTIQLPGGSILSGASTQGDAGAAASLTDTHADEQQQQQQGKQRRSKSRKPPLAGLKLLQPRSGSRAQVDCRAGGSARQAADMSDVFKALQYQAHSHERQQPEHALGDCAASTGPAAADAPPQAGLSEHPSQSAAAAAGRAAAGGCQPAGCGSSSSIGPCRTDLSGELAVIKQELSSNGSIDHASCNSSMMHLPVPGPSSSFDAGSSHSRGLQQQQQQEDSADVQQQQRKRQRPSFQYGNYHHYYGYRIGPSGFEDARLKVLDPSWFKGADVLDVGCNEGLLTLALAVGCCCCSMTGVDIDPALVAKACTNLSRTRSELTQQMRSAVTARDAFSSSRRLALPPPQAVQSSAAAHDGPLSIVAASSAALLGGSTGSSSSSIAAAQQQQQQPVQQQEELEQQQVQGQVEVQQHVQRPEQQQQHQWQDQRDHFRQLTSRVQQLSGQIKALTRVGFKAGNWLEQGCASNKYEVVTCFSVSKWVHLNWGDDGLMKLFHKFYRCLAPGGLLVLEPQPWKSYQAAVHKQGGTAAPFYKPEQLKLRPDGFLDFLTQRVGFELVQQLSAVSQAAGPGAVPVKGFDRPILVLRKPAALVS